MKTLHSHCRQACWIVIASVAALFAAPQSNAQTVFWDTDASTAGNDAILGTGLGGTGTWDTSTANWWDTASLINWPNTNANIAVFSYADVGLPVENTVTLTSGITANSVYFERSGYTLTGGELTLAGVTPALEAEFASSATIGSVIAGTDGLRILGGGTIRLTNNANTYIGDTNIDGGTLIITDQGALGLDTSIIDINGSASRSFGGGSLFLDGSAGGMTITRDVDISGLGPISDRGSSLLSIGDNTLTGTVRPVQGNSAPRITSIEGTLTFSGTVNTSGATNTNYARFGGINDVTTGNYLLNGVLTGDGNIVKSGGNMLHLDPTDTSGFSGRFRIENSTFNQGGIRVTNGAGVLGTRIGTGNNDATGAVLDFNSGILESRQDTQVLTGDGGAIPNVYQRANAVIVVDNAPSDTSIETGGTLQFGNFAADDNRDLVLEGRNGYNVTIGDITEIGGTGANMDIFNRLEGGILTIGNLQFSGGNGSQNVLFRDGANGSTVITGDVTAIGTGTKIINKDGQGTVTILGTGGSGITRLDLNGGTLAITDFRSIGGVSDIRIDGNAGSGSNGTSTLEIGTSAAPGSAADLTTSAPITIDGANGQDAIIRAVQTGANPVIFNGAVSGTVAGASRDFILGGTNTLDNAINGTITQNSAADDIRVWKIGSGTWVLGGEGNAYEGGTLIGQGTLKARANADASTIIPDDSQIQFVIHGNRPGPNQSLIDESQGRGTGTFEFVGFGGNSIETVGVLNADDNANTVRLTPNGGTASLIFAGIDEPDVDATINFVAPTAGDTITFTNYTGSTTDIFHAGTYFNGSDFALITGAATAVRAPIYGTDVGFTNAIDAGTFVAGDNVNVQADLTTSGALAIKSLRIDGSTTNTLTLGGTLTIQDNGAANNDGGIILTGGDATITGGNVTAGGTGDFYVRVDGAPNTLTLSSGVPNTSDGSFVKTGLGTLIIDTALNFGDGSADRQAFLEGTTRLSATGSLANRTVYLGHDALLELQGNDDSIRGLEGGGVIDNISANPLTLTVGNINQGGVFSGIITESGGGQVSVTKEGTATMSWDGSSTFTGPLTIGSTGIIDFSKLANIGVASSLGAGDATSDATNAASLVFTGNSATGNMGRINYDGWETVNTDRLFTLGGTGADAGGGIIANGVTNANMVWSNPAAIPIIDADSNQRLRLGGGNTGDNVFMPQLVDPSGTGVLSLYKQGGGNWALLNTANSYTGNTQVGLAGGTDDGVLIYSGTSLPAVSGLELNSGQIATSGTFTRDLVATLTFGNLNEVSMAGGGTNNNRGFASAEGDLTVTLSGGAALTWGAGGFIPDGQALRLNSSQLSNGEVNFTNDIDLGATKQFIAVEDNGHTGYDFATLSGNLSGTGGLRVDGGGMLRLTGDNSYSGPTEIDNAELHVKSLGNSAVGGNSSVGAASNLQADGILMQGAGNSPSVLVYTGAGEVSDRYISLEANAGNTNQEPRIYASGTGPLILTNLHNNSTAASKQLFLRGNNTAGNMITSVIGNSGTNALEVLVDGGATWILSAANTYSGTTSLNAGAAGVGNDAAFGTGTISMNNGIMFAHGADRTIANAIQVDNNIGMGFMGDHSLTFTDPNVVFSNTSSNGTIYSNIDNTNGDSLTFTGVLDWNSITANRTFSVNGNGDTNLPGGIDTNTAFGVNLNKNNAGTLTLGKAGVVNNGRGNGNTNIDNGTLRIAAGSGDGVLPSVAGPVLLFDPEGGEVATLDVNGNNTTVSALTTSGEGDAIIDNSGATDATFTFGANDGVVTTSANSVLTLFTDTGAGTLSIQKTGNTAAIFDSDVTLTHQGNTGVDGGGSLILNTDLASTSGLSVDGAGSLLEVGSLSGAAGVTSVVVSDGTLDLANGVGDVLNGLTTLSLGTSSSVTLNLDAGDSGTDLLSTAGAATTANTITLNVSDFGMTAGSTYTLLSAGSGLSGGTFSLGTTPGGFTGFTTNFTDGLVQITPTALDAESSFFWTGTTDNSWNGNVNNFSTDSSGATAATVKPGAFDTVSFVADSHAGGSLTTTLEESFTIGHLISRTSTATPTEVTLAPGAGGVLSLNPLAATDGITLETGSAPAFTISAPLNVLANQEWDIVDAATTLTLSGGVGGEADVSILGAGTVRIISAADAGFNSGGSSDITVGGSSTLILQDANALSGSVNAARITIDAGAAFYPEGASNIPNDIILNGGTLSTDNVDNRILLGDISTTADSTFNTREFNSADTTTEGRNILFRGALTGSNTLMIVGESDAAWDGIVHFDTLTDGSGADTSGFTGDWILDGGRLRYEEIGFGGAANFQTTGNFNLIGSWQTGAGNDGRSLVEWNVIEAGRLYDVSSMNVNVANATGDARGRLLLNELDTSRGAATGTTVVQLGTVTLGDANGPGHLEFDSGEGFIAGTDQARSQIRISGGVVLAGPTGGPNNTGNVLENTDGAGIHVIDGGISESGGSRLLTIRGASTANAKLHLLQDSTHTGGTFLDSGALLLATAGGAGTGDLTFNGGSIGASTDGLVIANNIEEADTNQIYFYGDDDNNMTLSDSFTIPASRTIRANGDLILDSGNTAAKEMLTLTGDITITETTSGTKLTLEGNAAGGGFIDGAINFSGNAADMAVNGGEWTFRSPITVPDELYVQTSDAILNLPTAGVLSFGGSTNASLRIYNGATVNLGATNAITVSGFDDLRVGVDGGNTGTFNMFGFDQTVEELILGNRNDNRFGEINGTGTLTVTANVDVYQGTINANFIQTGNTFQKVGPGTVILKGLNSSTTGGDTLLEDGTLVLDFTAQNNNKINSGEPLDMRGGNLILTGNDGAASSQTVPRLLLTNNAFSSNTITLNRGTGGNDILLEIDGDIDRRNSAQDGTLRINLPTGAQTATNGVTVSGTPNSNFGMLGERTTGNVAGYATVNDGTGTFFATRAANDLNIVALASTAKNDISTWLNAEHITDETTSFTGTVMGNRINSLRFDAAGGSAVNVAEDGVLIIRSGGILVTDQVTSGTPGIFGGTLASDVTELVITQDSAQTFEISSFIGSQQGITKGGAGTLLISGNNNNFNQETSINEGTLQVSGGNAISDISIVGLALNRDTTLELLADETIGRLTGGKWSNVTGNNYGILAMGSNTLTINQTSGTTFSGVFTGDGTIVLEGGSQLTHNARSDDFTGSIVVNNGIFRLYQRGRTGASSITVNKGGSLYIDATSTTRVADDILNTTAITLNSADGSLNASTIPRGLTLRSDQASTNVETVGDVLLNSGTNYVTVEGTTPTDDPDLRTSNVVRSNDAVLNVRGTNLGLATANVQRAQFEISNAGNQTAFIASADNLVGGGGAAASQNIDIVPWAIGETFASTIGSANMGNSFVTYDSGAGFRPLDLATEYSTFAAASADHNVRESLGADLILPAGPTTINSLVVDNAAFDGLDITGAGAGETLAVTSGALLFTVTGGAAATDYNTLLGGFDAGITVGSTDEYVISVVNDLTNTAFQSGTITSDTATHSTRVTQTDTTGLAVGMAISGQGIPVGATVASIINGTTFEMSLPSQLGLGNQTHRYSSLGNLITTISSPLTSAADITKSGLGTLILSGTNTAGGGSNKTTLNEGTLEIGGLTNIGGTSGDLVFAGGVLRLGAGFTDDISQRTISFLPGGGTIDTNGNDLTLASSLGSGAGGFTKTGLGNLTLNAAGSYAGRTTVLGGTLTVGTADAIGTTGDLWIGAASTVDIGANNISVGEVRTFGRDTVGLTGTGTVTAADGFFFSHENGTIAVEAVLAGPGGLFKYEGGGVALTGLNTYTGRTEVQVGTLSFDSIGNVGGGASALGAPTTVANGTIQTGFGGNDPVLTYTGSGHSTDRVINMNGTTDGQLTINANGTGALGLSTVQTTITSNRALILAGSSGAAIENSVGPIQEVGGALRVTKNGNNTWLLNTANAYTGATSVTNGILRISHNDALGTTAGTTTISGDTSDGVLELTGGITVGETIIVSSRQNAGLDNPALSNLSGNNEITSQVTNTTGGSRANIESQADLLTLSGGFAAGNGATGTRTVQFMGAGNILVSGVVDNGTATDGLSVIKSGTGTAVLSAANTYTGTTTVSGGTLEVNNTTGSGTGTGAVTLQTSTILGGSGIIAGLVTVESGGMISPGEGAALGTSNKTLTYTAASATAVTVEDGGQIQLGITTEVFNSPGFAAVVGTTDALSYLAGAGAGELSNWNAVPAADSADFLSLTGADSNLSLGTGAGTLTITDNGYLASTPEFGDVFNLIDWTQLSDIGGAFDATTDFILPVLSGGLGWDTSAFKTYGVIAVAPEPSRVVLLALGLFFGFFRRRR